MGGMGPLPKPPSQQRRPGRGFVAGGTTLPARGRLGRAPKWPLPESGIESANAREREIWTRLWHLPQAVQWELMGEGIVGVVARYARLSTLAETRYAKGVTLAEVRQLEDRLGLTPMAMARLQWVVSDVDGHKAEQVTDLRARIRAVAAD